ncbi:MAG TPA: MarR family transcriptional regulator [Kofleriaceae bacterium]|jgi:DNA-binding MarR family transcriptional regulator
MRSAHNQRAEAIRRSLVDLRRLFQRRELPALWGANALDYAEVRLLDAVHVAEPATVGDVARRLGIDPSRASRQVARAVKRGLLRRVAEQADARKVVLEVTSRGRAIQTRGSDLTRARIERAIARWTAAERAEFVDLFARFVAELVPA